MLLTLLGNCGAVPCVRSIERRTRAELSSTVAGPLEFQGTGRKYLVSGYLPISGSLFSVYVYTNANHGVWQRQVGANSTSQGNISRNAVKTQEARKEFV